MDIEKHGVQIFIEMKKHEVKKTWWSTSIVIGKLGVQIAMEIGE